MRAALSGAAPALRGLTTAGALAGAGALRASRGALAAHATVEARGAATLKTRDGADRGDRLAPRSRPAFASLVAEEARAALIDAAPAAAGHEAAAFGFLLGLALCGARQGPMILAATDAALRECGAPYAPGLAQFGVCLERLVFVRARQAEEALWAAEQALYLPGAAVLCVAAGKALDLTATRRLSLLAERYGSRAFLLRLDRDAVASAAGLRWRIGAAPSRQDEDWALGPPCFSAQLTRRRGGASGFSWTVEWRAAARGFFECGDVEASGADCAPDASEGAGAP